jgi:hypothetical protein
MSFFGPKPPRGGLGNVNTSNISKSRLPDEIEGKTTVSDACVHLNMSIVLHKHTNGRPHHIIVVYAISDKKKVATPFLCHKAGAETAAATWNHHLVKQS